MTIQRSFRLNKIPEYLEIYDMVIGTPEIKAMSYGEIAIKKFRAVKGNLKSQTAKVRRMYYKADYLINGGGYKYIGKARWYSPEINGRW